MTALISTFSNKNVSIDVGNLKSNIRLNFRVQMLEIKTFVGETFAAGNVSNCR